MIMDEKTKQDYIDQIVIFEKNSIESNELIKGQIYPFPYDHLGGFCGLPLHIINYNKEKEFIDNRNLFTRVDMDVNPFDTARLISFWYNLEETLQNTKGGDVAELGVYKGATAAILAKYCEKYSKELFLFDTFEGFNKEDFVGIDAGRCLSFQIDSMEDVKKQIGNYKNIHYKKGYFPKSLDKECNRKYCFVHIDCDLYKPIKEGLNYFSRRIVKNGIIVCHDYQSGCWNGATQAIDEFVNRKKWKKILLPDISGTVILIKT